MFFVFFTLKISQVKEKAEVKQSVFFWLIWALWIDTYWFPPSYCCLEISVNHHKSTA